MAVHHRDIHLQAGARRSGRGGGLAAKAGTPLQSRFAPPRGSAHAGRSFGRRSDDLRASVATSCAGLQPEAHSRTGFELQARIRFHGT